MYKKVLTVLVVLCALSCALFAVSKQRKAIDDFLKEYDTFVIKAEKAAETNKISDLTKLSMESLSLSEKVEKIENTDEWTLADSKKYLDLTTRYSNAINKLSGTTSSAAQDTNAAMNDMLKAYGL